jgi:hypothetical protein
MLSQLSSVPQCEQHQSCVISALPQSELIMPSRCITSTTPVPVLARRVLTHRRLGAPPEVARAELIGKAERYAVPSLAALLHAPNCVSSMRMRMHAFLRRVHATTP